MAYIRITLNTVLKYIYLKRNSTNRLIDLNNYDTKKYRDNKTVTDETYK